MGELLQYYKDGMKYFSEGNLNSAFNRLTLAVAGGLESEELYTAIALILIYKGEFQEAYKFFILSNKKYKDGISEKYLSNINEINECVEKHNLVVNLIKEKRYDEALIHLIYIRAAGFRTLNDDILICYIYCIKKDYKKCRQVLEEIHEINNEEVFYYEMKNYIDKRMYGKLAVYSASALTVIMIFSMMTVSGLKKTPSILERKVESRSILNKKKDNGDSSYKILAVLSNDIMKEDFYDFWINDKDIDVSKLDEESKALYNELKGKYNEKSELYFYENGLKLYKSGNYKKSLEYFSVAYENMKGDYLDEHIIFYMAKASRASGNNTTDYYRKYVNKYPKGNYIQEATYDLAIMGFNNNNIIEAKKYASIIVKEYANTMYNNDKIKEIMNK